MMSTSKRKVVVKGVLIIQNIGTECVERDRQTDIKGKRQTNRKTDKDGEMTVCSGDRFVWPDYSR